MIDWNEMMHRANRVHRFTSRYDTENGCGSCGADIEEGDEIGFVDDELTCSGCCDAADAALGS